MRKLLGILAFGLIVAAPGIAQGKAELEATKKKARQAVEEARWSEAVATYRKALEIDPKDASSWHMLGYSLHASGKLEEALEVHIKATEYPSVAPTAAYNAACVYALNGDKDEAFAWLKKAVKFGFANVGHMATDPDMDSLREDPRYEKITGAMKDIAKKGGGLQVYAPQTARSSARLSFWNSQGSPGQLVIDYGQPVWKKEYAEMIDSPKFVHRRWRLGQDFWTNMDSNLDMVVNGVEVPAGYYYLTVEHKGEREFVLAFNDANVVKKSRLDAYFAHMTKGGIEVPLKYQEVDEVSKALEIGVAVKEGTTTGKLWIHFGPHKLAAKVDVVLAKY